LVAAEAAAVDKLRRAFDELREGGAEKLLLTLFACQLIDAPEEVARFLEG